MSRSAISAFSTAASTSIVHPRHLSVPERVKTYNVPLGKNVKLTHFHHHHSGHALRSLRKLFESLFKDEATSGADESYMITTAAAAVGHRLSLMAKAVSPDTAGVLILPVALAVVFDEVYTSTVLAELQTYEGNTYPIWCIGMRDTRRPIEEVCKLQANAALYFRDALAEVSRAVHEFIRGTQRTTTTVTFKGEISRINEVDILAAVLPKFAFSMMNILLEMISYSCVDIHQEAGFATHPSSTPAGGDYPRVRRTGAFFKGSASLTTQGVAGASNTVIGHACLLFVVLTQLDENEYMRYCNRMGIPDAENIRGRRYGFELVVSKRMNPLRMYPFPPDVPAGTPITLTGKPILPMPKTPVIPRSAESPSPIPEPPGAPRCSRDVRNDRYWRLRSENNINELDLLMKSVSTRRGGPRYSLVHQYDESPSNVSSSSSAPPPPSFATKVSKWVDCYHANPEKRTSPAPVTETGTKRPRSPVVVDEPEPKNHRQSFDDDEETQPTGQTDSQFVQDFVSRSIDAMNAKTQPEEIDDELDLGDLTPVDPDADSTSSSSAYRADVAH